MQPTSCCLCSTVSNDVRVEEVGHLNVSLNLLNIDSFDQQVNGILNRNNLKRSAKLIAVKQTSANRGPDLRFVLEANHKPL